MPMIKVPKGTKPLVGFDAGGNLPAGGMRVKLVRTDVEVPTGGARKPFAKFHVEVVQCAASMPNPVPAGTKGSFNMNLPDGSGDKPEIDAGRFVAALLACGFDPDALAEFAIEEEILAGAGALDGYFEPGSEPVIWLFPRDKEAAEATGNRALNYDSVEWITPDEAEAVLDGTVLRSDFRRKATALPSASETPTSKPPRRAADSSKAAADAPPVETPAAEAPPANETLAQKLARLKAQKR